MAKSDQMLKALLNKPRERWSGYLGDHDGNVESDRPNEVYARIKQAGSDSYVVGSFKVRGAVRHLVGLPVWIEKDPTTGEQYIAGADQELMAYGGQGVDPNIAMLALHAYTHEWRTDADDQLQWMHPLQLYPCRVQPGAVAQHVLIQAGVYFVSGQMVYKNDQTDLDLSTYYPGSGSAYVMVCIDKDDAVTAVQKAGGGDARDFDEIGPAPAGTYMLAVVRLTDGADIEWGQAEGGDIYDLRFINQADTSVIADLEYIQFDTSVDNTWVEEGRMHWSADQFVPQVDLGGGLRLWLGLKSLIIVYNDTGSTLLKGKVIYADGVEVVPAGGTKKAVLAQPGDVMQSLAVMALDLDDSEYGFATTFGYVTNFDTSTLSNGDTLYLAADGGLTGTRPAASDIAIGICLYSDASAGDIFVNINMLPLTEELSEMVPNALRQPTGFEKEAEPPTDSVISYNPATREIEIAPTGDDFNYWLKGRKYTISSAQQKTHADVTGLYFFYWDSSNVLQFSTTPFDIILDVPIAYVYYNADLTDGIYYEERHGALRNKSWHYSEHYTRGTFWHIGEGLNIGDYTLQPGSPTDADNQFSISSGEHHDEDIAFQNGGLATGSYEIFYREGATGVWTWETETEPLISGLTYIAYNGWSGAAWILYSSSNNQYVNMYVVCAPSLDDDYRVFVIMGQAEHATLQDAEDETIADLDLSGLPFQELLYAYKLTFRTSASWTGATGRVRIEAVTDTRLTTSRSIVSAGTIAGTHNSLSGLQGGATGEYYHFDAYDYDKVHIGWSNDDTTQIGRAYVSGTGDDPERAQVVSYNADETGDLDNDSNAGTRLFFGETGGWGVQLLPAGAGVRTPVQVFGQDENGDAQFYEGVLFDKVAEWDSVSTSQMGRAYVSVTGENPQRAFVLSFNADRDGDLDADLNYGTRIYFSEDDGWGVQTLAAGAGVRTPVNIFYQDKVGKIYISYAGYNPSGWESAFQVLGVGGVDAYIEVLADDSGVWGAGITFKEWDGFSSYADGWGIVRHCSTLGDGGLHVLYGAVVEPSGMTDLFVFTTDNKFAHGGDLNTYLEYQDDQATFVVGGVSLLDMGAAVSMNAGRLAFGHTDIVEAWDSSWDVIEFSQSAIMTAASGTQLYFISNAYYDGAWKYKSTNPASYYVNSAGKHTFYVAGSGTADTAVTWIKSLEIDSSGKVSIKTTGTLYGNLHVYGTDANTGVTVYDNSGSTCRFWMDSGNNMLRITRGATDVNGISIDTSGEVYMLKVYSDTVGGTNRDLYIDDTGKLGYVSSSRRYKKNIVDLGDVDWLYNLRSVEFDYRSDGVHSWGLIAEEVAEVQQMLVSFDGRDLPESVEYSRLVVPLLKAVQQLKARVDALTN